MSALLDQHCTPLRGDNNRLGPEAIERLLTQIPEWSLSVGGSFISRGFRFADYALTIVFVNAVAAMADEQDHHPELQVSYGRCEVRYNTHDVGGLSVNDFICAAKADALAAA